MGNLQRPFRLAKFSDVWFGHLVQSVLGCRHSRLYCLEIPREEGEANEEGR